MVCAGSGRLEKLRIKEAMTRGALPHGGGGRRFAFGGRFECSCVAAFAPAAPWVRVCPGSAARKRFECPKDTRNAARRTQRRIPLGRALRTSRQEVRRARGPSELYSESGDMRGGFGSLAPARLPYAASRPGALRRRARGKRRTPAEKIGASRAFPPSESYLAFASLYTPSHHRIGNWITAAMAAVYSTHTSARPKCPPSRATPLKYT